MFTDIHSHVIWGVDDGAENEEETFRLLEEAAADGIGEIICTPHMTPGVYDFPTDAFTEHFRQAEDYIQSKGLPLALYTGAEILYTDQTPRLLKEHRIPTLAGTRYVLIEFSPTDTLAHIRDALQKTYAAGFHPVIAHMERYPAIAKTEQVRELKERYHALIQINARTLTRKPPLFHRRFFDSLFEENLADFIATDTHSMPGRGTCMTAGMQALRSRYGEKAAERIEQKQKMFTQKG